MLFGVALELIGWRSENFGWKGCLSAEMGADGVESWRSESRVNAVSVVGECS